MSVKTEKKNKKKKLMVKDYVSAAMLAVACSFLLFLYAPFEMFFTNKMNFWFDFWSIIGIDLAVFAVCAVVFAGVLIVARLIHENIYRVIYCISTLFFVSTFIEGSLLSRDLPILDGRDIDWSLYGRHRIFTILVIVILAAAVIVSVKLLKFEKFEKITRSAYAIIVIALFGSLIVLGAKNNGFVHKKRLVVNKDYEFEYSTDKNIIVFFLDAVDGDHFEEVLAEHPEYYEEFKDFTYYSNMLATYMQTYYSVPYLMTGVWYKGERFEPLDQYQEREMNRSALFKRLQRNGYRIGYYEVDANPLNCDRMLTFDNVYKADIWKIDIKSYIKNQIKLVGYRYAPFDLKRYCFVYYRDFLYDEEKSAGENWYYDYNDQFYHDLQTVPFTTTDDKFFKVYHIEGAHIPFVYDKDVNRIENGTYNQSVECSFTIAAEYIRKLKEAGVYDNSAIIFMSDHGFDLDDIPEGRMHAVFFAKGFGETKDRMGIDDAPVSFEDFQEAFAKLEQGATGDDLFTWKEGDVRDRKFYCVFYHDAIAKGNVLCVQHGHAGEIENIEVIEE